VLPEGPVRSVANLPSKEASTLLARLKAEGISAQILSCAKEIGPDISEIVVEEAHYDGACDIVEAWEAEEIAEAEKRTQWRCPKCRSPHLERVPHDKLEHFYRCADCGCEITF